MSTPREEELETMLRRLIGTSDRDQFLRPAEFELVKEARVLLGEAPEAPEVADDDLEDDLEPLGDGDGDRSPDFGPEGVINVVGVPVVEGAAPKVRASSPPASARDSAPRSVSTTGRVVLGNVMQVPPGMERQAAGVIEVASESPEPDALPYTPPPVAKPEEPLDGIILFKFPVTIGMACEILVQEQPRQPCRVQALRTNAPCAGFGRLEDVRFGNFLLLYDGTDFTHPDLFTYVKSGRLGKNYDMQPFDRVIKVRVAYTGLVPEGMHMGERFVIEVLLEGRVRRV